MILYPDLEARVRNLGTFLGTLFLRNEGWYVCGGWESGLMVREYLLPKWQGKMVKARISVVSMEEKCICMKKLLYLATSS